MKPYEELEATRASSDLATAWEMGGLAFFREYGKSGTCYDDFLPRTVPLRQKPTREPAVEAAWYGPGPHTLSIRKLNPVDLSVQVSAESAGEVHFARFHFLGWRAAVNGRPAPAVPHPASGIIVVPVPPGHSEVTLRYGTTPLQWATGALSLITLLLVGVYAVRGARSERRGRRIIEPDEDAHMEAPLQPASPP
jgi:hypothetical protein